MRCKDFYNDLRNSLPMVILLLIIVPIVLILIGIMGFFASQMQINEISERQALCHVNSTELVTQSFRHLAPGTDYNETSWNPIWYGEFHYSSKQKPGVSINGYTYTDQQSANDVLDQYKPRAEPYECLYITSRGYYTFWSITDDLRKSIVVYIVILCVGLAFLCFLPIFLRLMWYLGSVSNSEVKNLHN